MYTHRLDCIEKIKSKKKQILDLKIDIKSLEDEMDLPVIPRWLDVIINIKRSAYFRSYYENNPKIILSDVIKFFSDMEVDHIGKEHKYIIDNKEKVLTALTYGYKVDD